MKNDNIKGLQRVSTIRIPADEAEAWKEFKKNCVEVDASYSRKIFQLIKNWNKRFKTGDK